MKREEESAAVSVTNVDLRMEVAPGYVQEALPACKQARNLVPVPKGASSCSMGFALETVSKARSVKKPVKPAALRALLDRWAKI